MALGFNRGPESPIEVSDAERLAVSTDPGSPLQKAISGQQFLDKGFLDTGSLIAGGPKAFDVAHKAAMGRSDIRAQMAGKAMELTDRALRTRERQFNIDKERGQQADADDFFAQTEGMSPADQLRTATAEDLRNPAIKAALEGRAAFRKTEIGLGAAERGEKIAQATEETDFETALANSSNAGKQAALTAKNIDALLRKDSNPLEYAIAFADMDLPEGDLGKMSARFAMQGEEGDALRFSGKQLIGLQEQFGQALAEFPEEFDDDDSDWLQAGYADLMEGTSLSEATIEKMAKSANKMQKVMADKTAKKAKREEVVNRLGQISRVLSSLKSEDPIDAMDDAIKDTAEFLSEASAIVPIDDVAAEAQRVSIESAKEKLERLRKARSQAGDGPSKFDEIKAALQDELVTLSGSLGINAPAPQEKEREPEEPKDKAPEPKAKEKVENNPIFG